MRKTSERDTAARPDAEGPRPGAALDALLREIQTSAKYRHVCPDLIRRIGTRELAARRNLKEAVKETKNTLHQIGGAFLDRPPRYNEWLTLFEEKERKQVCADIMANHASTRERLPLLTEFYAQTLARVAPVRSVLDVCCGLNPLALPWMPLAPDAEYFACDIYDDMMAFLNRFFAVAGVAGHAETRDAAGSPPTQAAHVALLLKALPPLEQTDKTAGLRLLRALNVEHILVSFPTRSLGGQSWGQSAHYEARFRALIDDERWEVERFAFDGELCFLVSK